MCRNTELFCPDNIMHNIHPKLVSSPDTMIFEDGDDGYLSDSSQKIAEAASAKKIHICSRGAAGARRRPPPLITKPNTQTRRDHAIHIPRLSLPVVGGGRLPAGPAALYGSASSESHGSSTELSAVTPLSIGTPAGPIPEPEGVCGLNGNHLSSSTAPCLDHTAGRGGASFDNTTIDKEREEKTNSTCSSTTSADPFGSSSSAGSLLGGRTSSSDNSLLGPTTASSSNSSCSLPQSNPFHGNSSCSLPKSNPFHGSKYMSERLSTAMREAAEARPTQSMKGCYQPVRGINIANLTDTIQKKIDERRGEKGGAGGQETRGAETGTKGPGRRGIVGGGKNAADANSVDHTNTAGACAAADAACGGGGFTRGER